MADIILNETTHFIIQFDDSIGAHASTRATAVLTTCERDLQRLSYYMPYMQGGGGDPFIHHKIFVLITDLKTNRGGANNSGFHLGGQQIIIRIGAILSNGNEITDDYARFLFVAEMAEILMGFYGWGASLSGGEALSRIFAEEFYQPEAYAYGGAPWVNSWLNMNPRPDWVTKDEPSDINSVSFGCGMLFINYLRFQLNYSLRDICQAGGFNLSDHYRNLTGKPDNGFDRFRQLLEKHFPLGKPTILPGNNPFPLYDSNQGKVFVNVQTEISVNWFDGHGSVEIAPSFNCPVKRYRYSVPRRTIRTTFTAEAQGYGNPQFQWKVNGQLLSGVSGNATVNTSVLIDNPADSQNPTKGNENFTFSYEIKDQFSYAALQNILIIENLSFHGRYTINAEAIVSELGSADHASSGEYSKEIVASQVEYEKQFYTDRTACLAKFKDRMNQVPRLLKHIDDLLSIAHLVPPEDMSKILKSSAEIRHELQSIGGNDSAYAAKVAKYIATQLQMAPELFLK